MQNHIQNRCGRLVGNCRFVWLTCLLLSGLSFKVNADETIIHESQAPELQSVVMTALKNDPWLNGNKLQQKSLELRSIAAAQLPDPTVSMGIANLATDSFDFGQEPMTQLKIGVTQMFPRGNTLQLKQQQLASMAEQYPYQRQNREIHIAVIVANIWLDIYKAQQSIVLINQNRTLFEQLVDVAQVSYSSAVGKTRQQDIVRAQLELTRLEDRLSVLLQQYETAQQALYQWLSGNQTGDYIASDIYIADWGAAHSANLPQVESLYPELVNQQHSNSPQRLVEYFSKHPQVKAIDQKLHASAIGIEVEEQKYQPAWALNSSYAYRAEDPAGNNRADFFSIGLSIDVPLFTENRQDKVVESAVANRESIKTEKVLLLRQMLAKFATANAQLIRLEQRLQLYNERLLPQMNEQSEASLTAYTNDEGDFSEVVRARIAQLNSQIDVLNINVEQQKIIINLNALFATNGADVLGNIQQGVAQ